MSTLSETKNQHYISQAEQKLNAIEPSAPRKKRAIHAFTIIDRDAPTLSNSPAGGQRIEQTLSCLDLFSFDVVDSKYRHNLEELFHKYENRIADRSVSFLTKLAAGATNDLKEELVEFFAAKLMNMARNPFCVVKMLNTFGAAADYRPTDPILEAALHQVIVGSRPQAPRILSKFALTSEQYERWLRMLFMLLAPTDELNILDNTIVRLLNRNRIKVEVFDYTDGDDRNVCLLSDRGFIIPASTEGAVAMAFNINSRSFVSFYLEDPAARIPRASEDVLQPFRGQVILFRKTDYIPALVHFNQWTIYQAAHQVFAARPNPRVAL